jgi:Flp pilus assembly protein TadD
LEKALGHVRRAEQSDPLSPITHADLGHMFYLSRRYDEAMVADRKAPELDPNFARARTNLALVYLQTRAFTNAILE